jgi:hypothetical protein
VVHVDDLHTKNLDLIMAMFVVFPTEWLMSLTVLSFPTGTRRPVLDPLHVRSKLRSIGFSSQGELGPL